MVWNVAARSLLLLYLLFLEVNRESDVSHSVVRKSGPTGQVGNILHVSGTHDAFVEHGDIHVELVERYILLGKCANEIVKLKTCNRQYGLSVELGIVESVQKMNTARTRSSETDA